MKLQIKVKVTELKNKVIGRWHKISLDRRKSIIIKVETVLNYLVNAIIISVPLTIIFTSFNLANYFSMILCVWFVLPFIEHYYIWFRENWKNDIHK
jgi:hypothetical protein